MTQLAAVANLQQSDASQLNQFRTLFRGGFVYDVTNGYGADLTGVVDCQPVIQPVLTAASAAGGGLVYVTAGTYKLLSTLTIPSNVLLLGAGKGATTFQGSGITIVQIAGSADVVKGIASGISHCSIFAPTGNASTIGLKIQNGTYPTGGVKFVHLEHVIISQGATVRTAGSVGIYADFALENTFDDVEVQFWDTGVSLNNFSNANSWVGCKIRANNVGVLATGVGTNSGAQDQFFFGNTIEGNNIGVNVVGLPAATSDFQFVANHFENDLGVTPTNIQLANARYTGVANWFVGAALNRDIVTTTATAEAHSSTRDILGRGITHNGTAVFSVTETLPTLSVAGTGPVSARAAGGTSMTGYNASGTDFQNTGYRDFVFAGQGRFGDNTASGPRTHALNVDGSAVDTGQTGISLNNSGGRSYALLSGIVGVNQSGFTVRDVTGSVNRLVMDAAGTVGVYLQLYPGAEAGGTQALGGLLHSTGIPSNSNGNNNDWCISDNGHLYFKTGAAWVQKI